MWLPQPGGAEQHGWHNAGVSATAYVVIRDLLLGATAAMFALHLITGRLLRAGVRGVVLLRWEAAYYTLLLGALAAPALRAVLIPAVALAALHFAAWVYGERKLAPAGALRRNTILAIQAFDWGEALALAWIGWTVLQR